MEYKILLTETAISHIEEWRKSGDVASIKKIHTLFEELRYHPTTGTGQVEALRGDLSGYWSRRINKKDRLIYRIENDIVAVTVVSLKGHYSKK